MRVLTTELRFRVEGLTTEPRFRVWGLGCPVELQGKPDLQTVMKGPFTGQRHGHLCYMRWVGPENQVIAHVVVCNGLYENWGFPSLLRGYFVLLSAEGLGFRFLGCEIQPCQDLNSGFQF